MYKRQVYYIVVNFCIGINEENLTTIDGVSGTRSQQFVFNMSALSRHTRALNIVTSLQMTSEH